MDGELDNICPIAKELSLEYANIQKIMINVTEADFWSKKNEYFKNEVRDE